MPSTSKISPTHSSHRPIISYVDTTFKLNTDINDTDYFERLLEHDPAYQIHAGPQVSSFDLAAPVNDNHNDPPACTHPNAYNLHLITPYTLNDQHQQCTTIRDVTGLVVRNSEESHACVPNLEHSCITTSAFTETITNPSAYAIVDSTSLTTNNSQSHMPQTQRRHERLVFVARSKSMLSEMKAANILDVTPTTDP
ncbi:hypothetical protein Tco_1183884 [Tanacetum coccineum]